MPKQHVTQRVFLGIPIDRQARSLISRLLKTTIATVEGIRWVPENNRHLTLAFLGNTPVSQLNHLLRLADKTYRKEEKFQYSLTMLTRFPGSRGRIIALTGEFARPLECIFQSSVNMLHRAGIEFDQKRFRPHITLGRIKKPNQFATVISQPTNILLHVTEIVVYQSTLTESGSIYTALKKIKLS